MIGQITGILAAQGVNITDMTNKSRDKYAYTLLDLEHKPEAATIEKLKAIEGAIGVWPGLPNLIWNKAAMHSANALRGHLSR